MTNVTTQDIMTSDKGSYHVLDLQAELATLKPHTRRAYSRALAQFRQFCAEQGWEGPAPALLRRPVLAAWEAYLRGQGLASQTVGQYLAGVRWAAGLAADHGLITNDDLAGLRRVRVKAGRGVRQGRWLDADGLRKLLAAPTGARLRVLRDRTVLALLAGCGLRRAEVVVLTFANLAEQDGEPMALLNLTGKGDKLRSVAIPNLARPYLVRWLREYRRALDVDATSPIVCEVLAGGHGTITGRPLHPDSIYRIIRQATMSAGLAELAPHDLRRTAAKLMQVGGAGLVDIRDALGHASVATTERYLETARGPATGTLAIDRAMQGE